MQSSTSAQRPTPSQRRQQNLSDAMSSQAQSASVSGSQVRTTSGSGRSRTTNPDKQISQIEKSVTHLLVATKQLLETLTQWSRGQAQEEEVSDVYVRLGYEFNLACRAFNSIGVETSDLGPVPDLLRSILEDTLSQAASPQALDNYLPRIRDIIINLLHGLKRKQSRLRGRATKDAVTAPQTRTSAGQPRQASVSTTGSNETGLTHMLEDIPSATSILGDAQTPPEALQAVDQQPYPSTNASSGQQPTRPAINRHSIRRDPVVPIPLSDSNSTMSSSTAQNIPVLPPFHDIDQPSAAPIIPAIAFPHPPPPPPKQTDALARLQRGGDLERRASRRFSAYQIQKHLGTSPNGVPMIPSTQNSPIPNRGKEVRESMTAVRSRSSYQQSRSRSVRQGDASPSRSGTIKTPQRISEEREETPILSLDATPRMQPAQDYIDLDSPIAKTPDEYLQPRKRENDTVEHLMVGATVNGPLSPGPDEMPSAPTFDSNLVPPQPADNDESAETLDESTPGTVQRKPRENVTPPQSQVMTLDSSPPQGKELTLFLQYRSKIKKFVLADGYEELTIPRLQLAFIEKFAWNNQHNGVDLPEIYIQDPVSGVRHELEDLTDVKDRCVLVLNVEDLDEVRKHIDEGIGGLSKTLEGVKQLLEGQGTLMQRFSDRQLETSKEMARMSTVPSQPTSRTPTLTPGIFKSSTASSDSSLQEVQSLRREIAVLRQTYSSMSSDFAASMIEIKAKATSVKAAATDAANASFKGDAGRDHINKGKKTLSTDSEALVNRVDDLSDVVEELRKDVVSRGVRPLPRVLETISKDISATTKQLAKVKDYVKREKPIWTKIWEQELQVVMTERDDLTQQDELMNDLDGDLEDITSVFKLVEEATKQQNLQAAGTVGRNPSKSLAFDTLVDPHEAKTGVLDEVRALQPNHENRLEAIERAEKARQRELETRQVGEFQREVETFVEEGKLKKTGGMDEVERRRKLKDEQARKENFERQAARAAEMEKKRADAAAATAAAATAAAAAAAATEGSETNDAPHDPEHDTSQEGEAVFQDASEETVLTPEKGDDSPAPPPLPAKDTPKNEDPPQLPDVIIDGQNGQEGSGLDSPTMPQLMTGTVESDLPTLSDGTPQATEDKDANDKEQQPNNNRGSWWQPAVFSP